MSGSAVASFGQAERIDEKTKARENFQEKLDALLGTVEVGMDTPMEAATEQPAHICFIGQVLHKRAYGNRLVFLDVCERTGNSSDIPIGAGVDRDPSQKEPRGLEIVFSFEVYGTDVRKLRKDFSPGDVAEFEGSFRSCGRILDAVKYRIITRWEDATNGGSFDAAKVCSRSVHGGRERLPPKVKPEDLDAATGLQLCKFWMSNSACRRVDCDCAHPEGPALKEARLKHFQLQKQRKAQNANPEDPHSIEGKKSHGQRANVFAEWLCLTFGLEHLRRTGVVDIAGGRGELAFELGVKRQIPCITIDPRCPGEEMQLGPWTDFRLGRPQRAWLQTQHTNLSGHQQCQAYVASCPLQQCKGFVTKESIEPASPYHSWWENLVSRCSVVVGLHPDQATGAVVDLALAFDKSFAVAPCCTFADDFPERKLASGDPVRTYDDLVWWLKARSPTAEITFLGFQGKNLTVFAKAVVATPEIQLAAPADEQGPEEKKMRTDYAEGGQAAEILHSSLS